MPTNADQRPSRIAAALLGPCELDVVRSAFVDLFPISAATERHLRGVLTGVMEHPGSLVRAQLAYGILRGRGAAERQACATAIAIEYLHTASLVFDDLPCMDDAKTRRGHACPHVVHGEAAAILGALALVNRGYELLWQVLADLPPAGRLEGSRLVASCLGVGGILDGQALDLNFRYGPDAEARALRVAEGKTVSLVRLTLLLPAVVSGASRPELDQLERLSRAWGLGYQILDDFKDRLMTGAETGKTTDMDRARNRPNLPEVAGFDAARDRLDELLADGRGALAALTEADPRWRTLERLQLILEGERCEIDERSRRIAV